MFLKVTKGKKNQEKAAKSSESKRKQGKVRKSIKK